MSRVLWYVIGLGSIYYLLYSAKDTRAQIHSDLEAKGILWGNAFRIAIHPLKDGILLDLGPRPFLPHQQEYCGDTYFDYIHVRPRMTGLWQVSGRSRLSFMERVQLDEHYIRNWSLWLDLRILARTCWVVVRGEGAH